MKIRCTHWKSHLWQVRFHWFLLSPKSSKTWVANWVSRWKDSRCFVSYRDSSTGVVEMISFPFLYFRRARRSRKRARTVASGLNSPRKVSKTTCMTTALWLNGLRQVDMEDQHIVQHPDASFTRIFWRRDDNMKRLFNPRRLFNN